MIGAGLLGLPYAFGHVGLPISFPGSLVLALINGLGAVRLLQAKLAMEKRHKQRSIVSGDGTAESDTWSEDDSFGMAGCKDYGLGPCAAVGKQLFGKPGLVFAGVAVLGTQIGIGIAYVVYIGTTLDRMPWFDNQTRLARRIGVCVVLCILSQIRKLSSLAVLSLVALLAYALVVIDLVVRGWEPLSAERYITHEDAWTKVDLANFESWFGSTIFAFEGIVLAQYVFDSMRLSSIRAFMGVLTWSYGLSWAMFAFVGAYGFLAYGQTVLVPFYLSFPSGVADVVLDKSIIVFVLLLSFALQSFPIFSFVDSIVIRQKHAGDEIVSDSESDSENDVGLPLPKHRRGKHVVDFLVRSAIVAAMCVVADLLPRASCVTDLVGGVFMSLMAFTMPGAFHMMANDFKLPTRSLITDALLIIIGIASTAVALIQAPACFDAE
eukprot:TRINITY_DN9177_c0_g1_i1.p1 TRINITY_DN9177_c0_g1~~TRINITY_DN9177_c0_g1_i1.p1  ORF type:complete len:436 (-),score=63.54 TRINITY_DN9177_c0_g1_i1:189-1496(-)